MILPLYPQKRRFALQIRTHNQKGHTLVSPVPNVFCLSIVVTAEFDLYNQKLFIEIETIKLRNRIDRN